MDVGTEVCETIATTLDSEAGRGNLDITMQILDAEREMRIIER